MFITFEGPEGSGKTTQVTLLADALAALGREVVTTREPGGVPAAERIREMVLHERLAPETEALLFLAARAEHARGVLLPALARGAFVLCDRFTESTLAYQGYGLGLEVEPLRQLCSFASLGLVPDLTILLDLPPEQGLRRRFPAAAPGHRQLHLEIDLPDVQSAPQGVNKMENRDLEYHRRVREGFRKEAERSPERIYTVDASRPLKHVQHAIWREVRRRMDGESRPDAEPRTDGEKGRMA